MSDVSLQQHIYEMGRLITAHHLKIIRLFHRNNNFVRTMYHKLQQDYSQFNRPTEREIRRIVTKFEET